MTQTALSQPLQNPALRQFVKFCLIGFSSMVIDVGIARYLTYVQNWHWILAQVVSFTIAVTNGFTWNSLWTFRGAGSSSKRTQYIKFVLVNIIGLCLNVAIMKTMFMLFILFATGKVVFIGQGNPDSMHWNIAKGVAVICVSIWNFLANKKWTFS